MFMKTTLITLLPFYVFLCNMCRTHNVLLYFIMVFTYLYVIFHFLDSFSAFIVHVVQLTKPRTIHNSIFDFWFNFEVSVLLPYDYVMNNLKFNVTVFEIYRSRIHKVLERTSSQKFFQYFIFM